MNVNRIMRYSYWLGWLLAALAVVYRGVEFLGLRIAFLPVTSRGVLFASTFLFVACIATYAYHQVTQGVR